MAHKRAEVLPHPCVLGGPLQKGTEIKVAHKWAEVLHHPSALTGPKTNGKAKGGPQVGKSAASACVLGGPLHKGTEEKVAHKCAEVLNHPYVLGGHL